MCLIEKIIQSPLDYFFINNRKTWPVFLERVYHAGRIEFFY